MFGGVSAARTPERTQIETVDVLIKVGEGAGEGVVPNVNDTLGTEPIK